MSGPAVPAPVASSVSSEQASLTWTVSASSATPPGGITPAQRSPRGGGCSPRGGGGGASPPCNRSPRGGGNRSPRVGGISPRSKAQLESLLVPLSSRSKSANKINSARSLSQPPADAAKAKVLEGTATGAGGLSAVGNTPRHRNWGHWSREQTWESMMREQSAGKMTASTAASSAVSVVPVDSLKTIMEDMLKQQAACIVREVKNELKVQENRRELKEARREDLRRELMGAVANERDAPKERRPASPRRDALFPELSGDPPATSYGRALRSSDASERAPLAQVAPSSGSKDGARGAPRPGLGGDVELEPPDEERSFEPLAQISPSRGDGQALDQLLEDDVEKPSGCLQRLEKFLAWRESVKEIEGFRIVDLVVRSYVFRLVTLVVIMLNMLFLGVTLNNEISIGTSWWADNPSASLLKYSFTGFYLVELVLRMASEGGRFWYGRNMLWNVFDSFVIFGSVVGDIFSTTTHYALRCLRLFTIIQVVGTPRLQRVLGLPELAIMKQQILSSASALFWCVAMLLSITFIFAVYFMQAFVGESQLVGNSTFVASNWGSVSQSMLTLLMTTTGGLHWADVYRGMGVLPGAQQFLFLTYIVFFVVAVWNIFTGLFLNKALLLAKPDRENAALEERLAAIKAQRRLRDVLESADLQGPRVTRAEFASALGNDDFKAFLKERDISSKEAATVFCMLQETGKTSGQESVDIDAVVTCCTHIKGQASLVDILAARYEVQNMMKAQKLQIQRLEKIVDADYKVVGSPFHYEVDTGRDPRHSPLTL